MSCEELMQAAKGLSPAEIAQAIEASDKAMLVDDIEHFAGYISSLNEHADVTVEELLARDDLPDEQRDWLEQYAEHGDEWAEANNPPGFVANKGCWERAKRAANHVGASYAFANWWYHENC